MFNILSSKKLISSDLLGGLNKFVSKLCILNMCSSKSKTERTTFLTEANVSGEMFSHSVHYYLKVTA